MRIVTLLGLVLAGALAAGHAKEQQMTTGSKTHCLGRYLIDLPADAQMRVSYTYARGEVRSYQSISGEDFDQRVAARQNHLEGQMHGDGGSMFVERAELSAERVLLTSWESPASRLIYEYGLFSYFPQTRTMYVFENKGSASGHAGTLDYWRDLAGTHQYRAPTEIPTRPGFCIDSGLVEGSDFNREEVTANIRLHDYPTVTLTFMSYVTGNPDRELLRRTSTIPPGYEEVAARMQTLRRGRRNLGQVRGQELLVRGDGEGKKAYEFLWESQGQADSLEYPFLSLQLSTTGESDADGEVIDAPFGSNEEAMAVWDEILGSLRLRPGAVGR